MSAVSIDWKDESLVAFAYHDTEVDATLPLAVVPLSGDRKLEWETWVCTRPRGGEVGGAVVAVVDKEPKADEDGFPASVFIVHFEVSS